MTTWEVIALLDQVKYLDWTFGVSGSDESPESMQVKFWAIDATTGKAAVQFGRRWALSASMSKSEIIQTALKAVLTAIEHEARERFTYKGKAIFGPHFDVDFLATYCDLPVALDV